MKIASMPRAFTDEGGLPRPLCFHTRARRCDGTFFTEAGDEVGDGVVDESTESVSTDRRAAEAGRRWT
jgi:hypothetical protein